MDAQIDLFLKDYLPGTYIGTYIEKIKKLAVVFSGKDVYVKERS
jgi:hypothetical protein